MTSSSRPSKRSTPRRRLRPCRATKISSQRFTLWVQGGAKTQRFFQCPAHPIYCCAMTPRHLRAGEGINALISERSAFTIGSAKT
jgi:hypothetical protein